jgi:hypothetical protein
MGSYYTLIQNEFPYWAGSGGFFFKKKKTHGGQVLPSRLARDLFGQQGAFAPAIAVLTSVVVRNSLEGR